MSYSKREIPLSSSSGRRARTAAPSWPAMSGRLVLKRALVALLVLCVLTPLLGVLYVFFLFDWNNARDPLATSASARAGRKIVIEGDLRVDWGGRSVA